MDYSDVFTSRLSTSNNPDFIIENETKVQSEQASAVAPVSEPKPKKPPLPPLLRFSEVVGAVVSEAELAYKARQSKQPLGPVSGLSLIDKKLGGRFPVGLVPVLGNAGAGKSAFCLQLAACCGCPALYVSCEMAPAELLRRQMARVGDIYLGRLKTGEIRPDEMERRALEAAASAPDLAIMDATSICPTLDHLKVIGAALRGQEEHLLLVVDSLHSWIEGARTGATEYDALNAAMARLREMALEQKIVVMVICERNRASMDSGGLNSGAGSRRIEYGAEVMIDLQRDRDVAQDAQGETPVTLCFAKNRNGVAGDKVQLLFNGALQRFKEVSPDELRR